MEAGNKINFAYQIFFDCGFPRNAFSAKSRSQSHPESHPEFHPEFRARFRKRGLEKKPQGIPY